VCLVNKPAEVIIDVTDTGKGIPASQMKKVFKPGFTTKKRGWGLGLSLAKRIVSKYHHGSIEVLKSEPNVATTFRIIFKR
jgi:signal transduction histidine kinase